MNQMQEELAQALDMIKKGQPYKMLLKDGAALKIKKLGPDKYRYEIEDKTGMRKEKVNLRLSGLEKVFEKFAQRAEYFSTH